MNTNITADPKVASLLDETRKRIVTEKEHRVTEWDRIPLYKGSLVEFTFNFTNGPICNWEAVVPEKADWFSFEYDPGLRNDERAQDGGFNDRGVHAAVSDRPGLTLSANARLKTFATNKNGHVRLDKNLWDTLRANGFRLAVAYAQWKKREDSAFAKEEFLTKQIGDRRHQLAYLRSQLAHLEEKHGEALTNGILRKHGVHPDQVQTLERKCREMLGQIPVQKGWYRALFLHESHPAWTEYRLVSNFMVAGKFCTPQDIEAEELALEKDVRQVMQMSWGRIEVWNNPLTRTSKDGDLSRWPKIAIQLMNSPKKLSGGRKPGVLVADSNCLQVV